MLKQLPLKGDLTTLICLSQESLMEAAKINNLVQSTVSHCAHNGILQLLTQEQY